MDDRPPSEHAILIDTLKERAWARTEMRLCCIGTWKLWCTGVTPWRLLREVSRLESINEDSNGGHWTDDADAKDFEVSHVGVFWTPRMGERGARNHVLGTLADLDISITLLPGLSVENTIGWDLRKAERFKAKMRIKPAKLRKGRRKVEVYRTPLDTISELEAILDYNGERSCHLTWEDGSLRNLDFKWWEHLGSEVGDIRNLWLEEEDQWEDYREVIQYSSQETPEDLAPEFLDVGFLRDTMMNLSISSQVDTSRHRSHRSFSNMEDLLSLLEGWGPEPQGFQEDQDQEDLPMDVLLQEPQELSPPQSPELNSQEELIAILADLYNEGHPEEVDGDLWEEWDDDILQGLELALLEAGEVRDPPGAPPVSPTALLGPGETCGGNKRKLDVNWMEVLGIEPRRKRVCLIGRTVQKVEHVIMVKMMDHLDLESTWGLGVGTWRPVYRSEHYSRSIILRDVGTQTV